MAARAAGTPAPAKGSAKGGDNAPAKGGPAAAAAKTAPEPPKPAAPKPNTPIDKEAKKELQKNQRRFEQVEADIAKLKKQKTDLEAALGTPDVYADAAKFQQTEKAYKDTAKALDNLNAEYEILFEKLVELGGA
jgi:ATP-binding cassette subfamily F protein 3